MTYNASGLIQATDYNGFASTTVGANVNGVWGVGSGDTGWGQTNTLGTVGAETVTATQWSTLCARITSMANQTNTTITARTSPTAGTTIDILAALNTDLTNCTTNRGNAASYVQQANTWTGSIAKTTDTGLGANPWTITWTQTVTFPSANQARYFWNAGGWVILDMIKTSTGTDTDPDWNTFVATVGQLVFSGRVNGASQLVQGLTLTGMTRYGGSGTPSPFLTTTGWYSLTPGGAATNMFQLTSSVAPYTADFIRVTAAVNAASTVFTLVTTWSDSGSGQTSNISGGTDTPSPFTAWGTAPAILLRVFTPGTTYLANTWGTPAVASSVV